MKNAGIRLRVLVVDDSAVVRQVMAQVLGEGGGMDVTVASDPLIAMEKMKRERPDVIVLDLNMPRMDGMTFLRKVMSEDPIPVVICSGYTARGTESAIRALQEGAIDVVGKPSFGLRDFLEESASALIEAVRGAATANMRLKKVSLPLSRNSSAPAVPPRPAGRTGPLSGTLSGTGPLSITLGTFGTPGTSGTPGTGPLRAINGGAPNGATSSAPTALKAFQAFQASPFKMIVIGASTGGTEALRFLLGALPANSPGIVVVQHMPAGFTAAFAQNLNQACTITVKEARSGDEIRPGLALIAPGNRHVLVRRTAQGPIATIDDGPAVNRHRPSVDVLFESAAKAMGSAAMAILLTGMGADGAAGMLKMRNAGSFTVAQDEASSVVFGMPREAIALGAAAMVAPLSRMPEIILANASELAGGLAGPRPSGVTHSTS